MTLDSFDEYGGMLPLEEWSGIDEFLHPFERLFVQLADLDGELSDPSGLAMRVERAEVSTPIEMDVAVDDEGYIQLKSSPPTQHVETTYMPVFHRVRMVVAPDAGS